MLGEDETTMASFGLYSQIETAVYDASTDTFVPVGSAGNTQAGTAGENAYFSTKMVSAEGKTIRENAAEAKKRADKLPSLVPSLKAFECVVGAEFADKTNYDIALICDFEDEKGLDEYQNHPDHKAFGAYISTIREDGGRACIDYIV